MKRIFSLASFWLALWVSSAAAQPPATSTSSPVATGGSAKASAPEGPTPFLLGGIQTHELDHQRWMAALHQSGMNAVQATVYAQQGPWSSAKLWYQEEEPAVLNEIRTARQNGLQVVLVLRVALDHGDPENRFLWHGLTYPESEDELEAWFRTYTDFAVKWARIAEEEGVEVLGIASEMNALSATLPIDELPNLPEWYLDDESQQRLRDLVNRFEPLFNEEVRLSMGAGDIENLDDFLVMRNEAERGWAKVFTYDPSDAQSDGDLGVDPDDPEADPQGDSGVTPGAEVAALEADEQRRVAAMNQRRQVLDGHWRALIEKVRQVYTGRLTLAANFDNYHEVSFWDALDFMGINAYFPLRESLETPVSEAGLLEAWRAIFQDIDAFREKHGLSLPVVFTELGYTRWQGVTVAPWSSDGFIPLWDPEGDVEKDRAFFWKAQPYDPSERALAMRALYRLWREGGADLAGVLYWKLSSQIHLQRYEPFMLYLGKDSQDPLYDTFIPFADHVRPLSPRLTEGDLYRRAVDAIVRDDPGALESLGSRILGRAPSGQPPLLHLASRLGRRSSVRHLLGIGARLEERDAAGHLPIHWACYQDDPELVDLLLPPAGVSWRDDLEETPLMKCARLDKAKIAHRLLHRGAKVGAQNTKGSTALHLAADQASKATIEILIRHGAEVDIPDQQASTPLHIAARRGQLEIIEWLVAQKGKGEPNRDKNRPVQVAAYYGKPKVFHLLFEPDEAREKNTQGQSLLHLAAHGGDMEILRTLEPFFPNVDESDEDGWTPLFYAIKDAYLGAIDLLLAKGASVEHRAVDGTTPLHRGASCKDSRVLQRFLARQDIDIHLVDKGGNTPLHHAAGWGFLENIRLLIAAGAELDRRNDEGETAFEVADKAGRRRAAQLLEAAANASTPADQNR